tara:strand:+ start:301 stop:534 length:234 start_codon:yes stop_codon:yes gene_type:complete
MFTLYIYSKDTGIHSAFVKANSYIIKKYKTELLNKEDKFNHLRNLWKKECKIDIDEYWCSMNFPSKNALDMFLLRWS